VSLHLHISYKSLLPLLLALLILSGCAGKRTLLFEEVRNDLRASDTQKAYTAYKSKIKSSTERVDELLNLGLLAFEAGDYAAAVKSLSEAEKLAEERLTKSLSREGAALATSDRVRAYQGTVIDKAMLHYYASLAYLAQNQPEASVIEGRRIGTYLEVNARESKHTYKDDAFLQWFSGSLYHSYGQINDAWISYKKSRELYDLGFYDIPEPSYLCPVTLEAARGVGHSESETALEEECPGAADKLNPEWGRVIVLCEAGLAPPILENNIMFPIMKNERDNWSDENNREAYAGTVYERGQGYQYNEAELDYFVRVALPYYPSDYSGSAVSRVSVRADDGLDIVAELGTNVGEILREDLSDRMPAIAVRAIIRGITKYAAAKAAEKAGGKDETKSFIFGTITNLIGAATEAADTRSWETLPDRIYAADFQLPPGEHTLRAVFDDGSGSTLLRQDFNTFTLKPGEIVILRARCLK
jgi:hypothetical protein